MRYSDKGLLFQAYDRHLQQLTEVGERACRALQTAGINYRIIGGLAVLFHVRARDPLAARLTKDVDLAVDRADIARIAEAVRGLGLEYRHVAGADMLVDAAAPSARSAVHLVFIREKVRPQSGLPEELRDRLRRLRAEEAQSTGAE